MASGFSSGDFIAVGELAWTVYRSCKAAPGQFKEISKDLSTLYIVLKNLEDDAENKQSPLNRRGGQMKDTLCNIIDSVLILLHQLDDLVTRYQSLGCEEKKTWVRTRFVAKEIDIRRTKLNFYVSSIDLFMDTLGTSSLAQIEAVLDNLVEEVQAGNRKKSIISVYENDDGLSWHELEAELANEGISKKDLEPHKESIKAYLKQLMGDGLSASAMPQRLTVSVLFVCFDNICRSPMAEHVFRHLSKSYCVIGDIDSAGTGLVWNVPFPGEKIDPNTLLTLSCYGITANEGHTSRKVNSDDFKKFDYMLAMDAENAFHLQTMKRGLPFESKTQIMLFESFTGNVGESEIIPDPYNRGMEEPKISAFKDIFHQCMRLSHGLLEFFMGDSRDPDQHSFPNCPIIFAQG